jgi:ubiquinone/menaquinone biosynthesis C-methylase UbiE
MLLRALKDADLIGDGSGSPRITLRRRCFRAYWRMQRRIAPALRDAQVVYEDRLRTAVESKRRWLDLGCGHQVLQHWRFEAERALVARAELIVGLDLEHDSLSKHRSIARRTRGDLSRLPFADGSFDLVTANMVMEHLANPAEQLAEIARVLRPGGVFVAVTPNRLGYQAFIARMMPAPLKRLLVKWLQDRASEDLFHTYYRINTAVAIQRAATRAGFAPIRVEHVMADAQFAVVPPLAALELLLIRMLMTSRLRRFRPNLIAQLEKPRYAVEVAEG